MLLFFKPEKHCAHAYPRVDDIPHPVTLEAEAGASSLVRDKRDAEEGNSSAPLGDFEQQLRIKVFYHSSVKDLDKVRRRIVVEQVVPEAVNYWEQVIKKEKIYMTYISI